MPMTFQRIAAALSAASLLSSCSLIGQGTDSAASSKIDGALRLEGVAADPSPSEIRLDPRRWKDFIVKTGLPDGSAVAQGAAAFEFDPKPLADAVEEADSAVKAATTALRKRNLELTALEREGKLRNLQAELDSAFAEQDLGDFVDSGRPLALKTAEADIKTAKDKLNYSLSELEQLERMYKADKLVEETEEMIMRRQKDQVERLQYELLKARHGADHSVRLDLARQDAKLKMELERKREEAKKTADFGALAIQEKRVEVDAAARQLKTAEERLAELRADQSLMRLACAKAGILVFGQSQSGKFDDRFKMRESLRIGQKAPLPGTLAAVHDASVVHVYAEAAERDLPKIISGSTAATATSRKRPGQKIQLKLHAAHSAPSSPGKFLCDFVIVGTPPTPALAPCDTLDIVLDGSIDKQSAVPLASEKK